MIRTDCELYRQDVARVAELPLPWENLAGKSLLLSGGTGMIGSFLTDVLMERNERFGQKCTVYSLTRNPARAASRATSAWKNGVRFLECDLNRSAPVLAAPVDFVIHAASNTHPAAYATDPIGTIATNIIGTQRMLELAADRRAERVIFLSSVEIYGENRGDCERFDESYCGYLDCNTLRAGYPEGKRAGEALCQAYIRQKELDVVIPRLPRIFGPTMLASDTKAISQFIKKGISRENIVLKSNGSQQFSYCYVADAVSGILYCLLLGKNGNAYNLGDAGSDISLKDLAWMIAEYVGTQVVFELPDQTEKAGYSKASKAMMDGTKLKALGWQPHYSISTAISRTLEIMLALQGSDLQG